MHRKGGMGETAAEETSFQPTAPEACLAALLAPLGRPAWLWQASRGILQKAVFSALRKETARNLSICQLTSHANQLVGTAVRTCFPYRPWLLHSRAEA